MSELGMMERRSKPRSVYVVERERLDGSWSPVTATLLWGNATNYQKMFPGSRIVLYYGIEEPELSASAEDKIKRLTEELEVYTLALRKACAAPSFIMTPPDPWHYLCAANEAINEHKRKTEAKASGKEQE